MRKSTKSRKARGTPTGVRRFFFKLELLGKRRANPIHSNGNISTVVDTSVSQNELQPPDAHSPGKENLNYTPKQPKPRLMVRSRPKRAALITEDAAESATIITTFDDIPFCCHEDLVTMSRERLIEVATSLNAKLPSVLAINIDHSLPTSHIRQSIERIVGLRGDAPKAPKALRMMTDSECNRRLPAEFDMRIEMSKTPPTSPLASRGRGQGQPTSLISPLLARLEEEDEYDMNAYHPDRSLKRRKLSFDQVGSEDDSDTATGLEQTPTPLPGLRRAISYSSAQRAPQLPARILRSQSHHLGRSATVDTVFTRDKRSRTQYRARQSSFEDNNRQSLIPKPIGALRRSERLRPTTSNQTFVPLTSQHSIESSRLSSTAGTCIGSSAANGKRKRGIDGTEAEQQIMSGIKRMNMTGTVRSFEMDVGP